MRMMKLDKREKSETYFSRGGRNGSQNGDGGWSFVDTKVNDDDDDDDDDDDGDDGDDDDDLDDDDNVCLRSICLALE